MGKDNNNGKDSNSEDDGYNGKEDNNDGGNGDRGGGGVSAGGGQGNVDHSSLLLVARCLHNVGIMHIYLGMTLFWSKFYLACPDMLNRIYSIRIYSRFIPSLFWSKSGSKPFRPILAVTQ
jgi:hypothetical protein